MVRHKTGDPGRERNLILESSTKRDVNPTRIIGLSYQILYLISQQRFLTKQYRMSEYNQNNTECFYCIQRFNMT